MTPAIMRKKLKDVETLMSELEDEHTGRAGDIGFYAKRRLERLRLELEEASFVPQA